MAPIHDAAVRQEIYVMVKAGIITPAGSPWSFPVVLVTKKNVKPRLFVDHRVLNRGMKADRFPLLKIN